MRVLVVAPHADDETLGCGGTMLRHSEEGDEVDLAIVSIGNVRWREQEMKATAEARLNELHEACAILRVHDCEVLFEGVENRLDSMQAIDLIARIDRLLDRGYDRLLFPHPSHHQDHRIVYDACVSALREGARTNSPVLALTYEYTYPVTPPISDGRVYFDITAQMDRKLQALSAYRSQLYPTPHPISLEAADALGRLRGVECGRRYAELFGLYKAVF